MRIFIIGYMGSGKTTVGRAIAERLNLSFVDMDAHVERYQFKTVQQIFLESGEEKFRELERKCLLEVSEYEDIVVATGGGTPCFFDNMEVMNRSGKTIYIRLTPEELSMRLKNTNIYKRPIVAGYQGDDLETFIDSNLKKRELYYNQAKFHVSGTDKDLISKILEYLTA